MLLVIHNLPIKICYGEVKAFIKERCNLQDFILDNLVFDGPQSRKVTIGLSDEIDVNKVTKELNGLVYKGQKLYVEDLGKYKRSRSHNSMHSDQGYARGNMSQNTDNTKSRATENQAPMQPMSSMPIYKPNISYNNPYYMFGQRTNQNPVPNDQGNTKGIDHGNKSTWLSESQPPKQPVSALPQYMQRNSFDIPYYMYGQRTNQIPTRNDQGNTKGIIDGNKSTWPSESQPTMQPASAVPQYMQRNSFDIPYYMYGQGSPSCVPGMTPIQPTYGTPCTPIIHNTNTGYSGPSKYNNNQQPTAASIDTQPDYIRYANENSQDKYSIKESGSSRYFVEKNNQTYRDRNGRPLSSRDECANEPRSRSNERRYDDWNDSETYQRSGSTKMSSREDEYAEKNLKQSKDSYNQSYDREYEHEPDKSGYSKQRSADDRHSLRNESSYEVFKDVYNRYDSNANDNYNRPSNKPFVSTNQNSRYKWIKTNDGNAGNDTNFGGTGNRKTSNSKASQFKGNNFNHHPNPKNQINQSNKYKELANMTQSLKFKKPVKLQTYSTKAIRKYMDSVRSPIERKDETLKCQAVSKIVRDAMEQCGFKSLAKKQGFLPFLKSLVRTRIDNMLGRRMAVPLETIVEEYDKMYPPSNRECFILEARAKFKKGTIFPSGAVIPIRRLPIVVQMPKKRKAPPQELPKVVKKKLAVEIPRPPPYRAPSPGPLPKYPNADKKAYKRLKMLAKEEHEKEIYTLEPKLKEALDNEMKPLEELYKSGCLNNDGGEDAVVCKKLEKISEEIFKVIKLDITKRLLNVTCNLPLRMFVNGRFRVKELGPKLKPYGIISCRKSNRSKMCTVVCQDYPNYDYLCTKGEVDIGEGLILRFKPLNLAGPRKKCKRDKNQGDNADHGSEEDEVYDEAGNEDGDEGADDDIDSDGNVDDDEMDTWHDEENLHQEDVKHVEIIEDEQYNEIVETVKPKDELIKNEKTIETVEQCKDDKSADIKILLKDIKDLTDVIVDGDVKKDVEVNVDTIDVANIDQDDLEDY